MKVKLQFDPKAIQVFLLQHVEKIGFALIALIFLFMVYSAFVKGDPYERSPDELLDAVQQAERTIENTPPKTDLAVQDYAARAKRSRIPIQEKHYLTEVAWDNPLFPTKPPRPAPPLLAAHDLRVNSDTGAVQMAPETTPTAETPPGEEFGGPYVPSSGMDSGVRGQRWIVLTALVPKEKQEIAYMETFRGSKYYDPQADVPQYLGYWVQRVEVPGPSEAAEIDWSRAEQFQSNKAMIEAQGKWAQSGGSEVVEQKFIHQRLVFPLAPLADRQWDEAVAHEPEIPLRVTDAMGRAMGAEGGGFRGRAPGGGFRPPGGEFGEMGPEGYGPRRGARDPENDPFSPKTEPDAGEAEKYAEQNRPPSHLLLRFFDFNVEPGKHYVYRVRLGLRNPNCDLPPKYLEKPDLADPYCLETEWSEPSGVVSVPRDTRVLAVSVTPGRGSRDPVGRVMLAKWVQRRGFTAYDEFEVQRGEVLNYPEKKFRRVEGGTQAPGGMGGMMPGEMGTEGAAPDMPGMERAPPNLPRGGRRNEPRRRPPGFPGEMPPDEMMEPDRGPAPAYAAPGDQWLVNYYANAVAIDFRGGERLSGRRGDELTSIGEILLLDAEGNLVVRNELEDRSEREKLAAAESASPAVGGPLNPPPANMPHPRGALKRLMNPNSGRGHFRGR